MFRIIQLLLLVAILFVGSVASGQEPFVRTEIVKVQDFVTTGYGENEKRLHFFDEVPMDGVSLVAWEALVVQVLRGAGGQDQVTLSVNLLAGDQIAGSMGLEFPYQIGGQNFAFTARYSSEWFGRADSVDGLSIRIRQTMNRPGAGGIRTSVESLHEDGALRIHFVHGSFGSEGPNQLRIVEGVGRQDQSGPGATIWDEYWFDEPVSGRNLRLVTQRPPFMWWVTGGLGTSSQSQLILDDDSPLPLDDIFSPSTGAVADFRGNNTHALLLDSQEQSKVVEREIVGWRWRVRHDRQGETWFQPSGGDRVELYFAYDSPSEPETRFLRGDCNTDGEVNISDATCILNWLFAGGDAPGCVAATNTNGDDAADITDATYLLNHLFAGGPAPIAPFPDCGPGMLPQELSCANAPRC